MAAKILTGRGFQVMVEGEWLPRQEKSFRLERQRGTKRLWSVWWDSKILPGQELTSEIKENLHQASCVVVVWSQYSVASQWVSDEARYAAEKKKLIPVLVEDVTPLMK